MTALSVLLVDDEPLARQRLARGLARIPFVGRVEAASGGAEALAAIRRDRPDVVLLDVRMPGLSGFDVIDRLPRDNTPVVVLATAFEEYAIRAFEHAAVDYVLKPIRFDRLEAAMRRAAEAVSARNAVDRIEELQAVVAALRGETARLSRLWATELWVRSQGEHLRVPVDRIVWISAEGDYARLHLEGRTFLHEEPLGALEKRLDPDLFIRIHRSAIVRIEAVRKVAPRGFRALSVTLPGGEEAPVGRTYVKRVKALIEA
jgi:two-component system response regulator AlgR